MRKQKKKLKKLIDKKLLKLDENIKKKTDYLLSYKRWKTFKT